MKKFFLAFILAVAFLGYRVQAQTTAPDTVAARLNLKSSAQKMVQLFQDKDYTEYLKHIHPALISMVGGKDKLLAIIKSVWTEMEKEGFTIKSITVGEPLSILISDKEFTIRCTASN